VLLDFVSLLLYLSACVWCTCIHGNGIFVRAVDPVDGTANLAAGIPLVTTCIALCWRGEVAMGVIYDPNRDEMFVAR